MKRLTKVTIVLLILVFVCCTFVGCDQLFNNNRNESGNLDGDGGYLKSYNSERYLANASASENELTHKYTDGIYNYFYFYLGEVDKVPIAYEQAEYYNGIETTITYDNATNYEKAIAESTTTCIDNTTTITNKHSVGVELNLMNIVNLQYNWERTDTSNTSISTSDTISTAKTWSESNSKKVEYKLGKDLKYGYYRYTLFAKCDIFAVVAYNLRTKKCAYNYLVCARPNTYFNQIDYSESNNFPATGSSELEFDVSILNTIDLAQNINGNEKPKGPIKVNMLRKNCNDGNNYDYNKPEESAAWRNRHNNFEIGELYLYGSKKIDSVYSIEDQNAFSLKYKIIQNINMLPLDGIAKEISVADDGANRVMGTNINTRVGKGAYWVRITYDDDVQNEYNKTNFMNNKVIDSYIELVSPENIDTSKKIKKIEVVVAYELFAGAPGFLDIWWKEFTNWHCSQTFNFI